MYLPPENTKAREEACAFIRNLDPLVPWTLTCARYKPKRSNPQNRYYWGTVVRAFEEHTGYTRAEIHHLLKCEILGYRTRVLGRRAHQVPIRGTSDMDVGEFADYVDACVAFAGSQLGLYIPLPGETYD